MFHVSVIYFHEVGKSARLDLRFKTHLIPDLPQHLPYMFFKV